MVLNKKIVTLFPVFGEYRIIPYLEFTKNLFI